MWGFWNWAEVEDEGGEAVIKIRDHLPYYQQKWAPGNQYWVNPYAGMGDQKVKDWFANKIKFIIKDEGLDWRRDNEEESEYMHDGLTVRDCYQAYDKLKGRIDRTPPKKAAEPVQEARKPAEGKSIIRIDDVSQRAAYGSSRGSDSFKISVDSDRLDEAVSILEGANSDWLNGADELESEVSDFCLKRLRDEGVPFEYAKGQEDEEVTIGE